MPQSRLDYLFESYVQGKCTVEEKQEFMGLVNCHENEGSILLLIDELIKTDNQELEISEQTAVSILENIFRDDQYAVEIRGSRNLGIPRWLQVAAALIFFLTGFGYWLFINKHFVDGASMASKTNYSISPGGNHAMLTMSSGKTVWLDNIQNGAFLTNGVARIQKQNGLLNYEIAGWKKNHQQIGYNTLSTPRGGEYEVVLEDGTKVWLNSVSSLRFPIAFTGKQRVVELQGEGYFEVAKNSKIPFLVRVGDVEVKVLGTHFNLSAYTDETEIKASLIEGSIRITKGDSAVVLKPGEQATILKNENTMELSQPNLDKILAWKNGLFQFEDAGITTIMKDISRWYNVDVLYKDNMLDRKFYGKISRGAELNDVLKILELSNVRFKLNGDQVIVE